MFERKNHLVRGIGSVENNWETPAIVQPWNAKGFSHHHDGLSREKCFCFINFNISVKNK